jgi:serine/threonine protein kinase
LRQFEPRIPHLKFEREINAGGMGVVYSVLNQRTARREALKVPRDIVRDPASLDRFKREYMIQQGLGEHPNLIRIYEAGTFTDGVGLERPYYTMECIDGGRTLRHMIDEGAPVRRLVQIMQKVATAVAFAAQKHVHHGDLKPSNILIRENGEPAVSDFGIARNLSVELSSRQVADSLGRSVGTHDYMSPAQASSATALASQTDDVYSMGIMLYEVIAGRRPYAAMPGAGEGLAEAIRRARVPELRVSADQPDAQLADPWIRAIVARAMHKDEAERYPDAKELAAALASYLDRTRWTVARLFASATPTPLRFWGAALLGCLVAVAVSMVLTLTGLLQVEGASEAFSPARKYALGSPGLDDVRVIAITDDTPLAELSKRYAPGHPQAEGRIMYPFRATHAELARRMTKAQAFVVAWDIGFSPNPLAQELDKELASAIVALRESGTATVIATWSWKRVEGLPIDVSPTVARAALRFGGISAQAGVDYPWIVDAFVWVAPNSVVEASLSVIAYAAMIRPGAYFDAAIDQNETGVVLSFWRPLSALPGGRAVMGTPIRLKLSMRETWDPAPEVREREAVMGFETGSVALGVLMEVPSAPELQRITIPIERVLRADDAQLRDWFQSKVVFVGDVREDIDMSPLPISAGGGKVAGVYVQATAAGNLLANLVPRVPSSAASLGASVVAVGLFIIPLALLRLPRWAAGLWAVSTGASLAGLCWLITTQLNVVMDPGPLIIAGALACLAVAVARSHVQRKWELTSGA